MPDFSLPGPQAFRPVPSPCIKICKLNQDQICTGCGRSRAEIGNWSNWSNPARRACLQRAEDRLNAADWLTDTQPESDAQTDSKPPRSGFTLVELLVVIAIIGILVGLLLPAVQAVREAARKTQCKNNLHQLGIALHMYHDVHKSLPMGCLEWRSFSSPPTHRQMAWSAMLLPFLEQQNVHDQIDFGLAFDAPENAAAAAQRISAYECPTAPEKIQTRGRTDYGGLYGERINDRIPEDGLFLYETAISFRGIRDGLTQTLAVAEDVGGPDSEWINGRNVFVQAYGINDPEAWIGDNEIRSLHPSGAIVLFADGRTQFMAETIDKTILGKLITRSGGETVSSSDY